MKFSEDYVDLVENIIILITVALWEIFCRNVLFHTNHWSRTALCYHGNGKIMFWNKLSSFLRK